MKEVRGLRLGKNSKDFDNWPEEACKYDTGLCFVIVYGSECKTFSVVGRYKYYAKVLPSSLRNLCVNSIIFSTWIEATFIFLKCCVIYLVFQGLLS